VAESTRAQSASAERTSGVLSPRWGAGIMKPAACTVLLLALGSWLVFLWQALHAPVGQYDFSSYYAAALAIRLNPHAEIYAANVLASAGAHAHVQVQPPLPYTYPPLMAILLSPFTLLSFRVVSRLWLLVNAGLCLVVVAILANEIAYMAGPSEPLARRDLRAWLSDPVHVLGLAIAAAIVLPAAPARQTMLTGQIDLLVLLPLALVPALLRGRRDAWAGAAVALAAMLKLTPGVLLLYFVLRGHWRAFWSAIATLVGLALVSIAVVGPEVFFASIPEALRVGSGDVALGQNEALFAPVSAVLVAAWPAGAPYVHAATYVLLAALALALGRLVWQVGRGKAGGELDRPRKNTVAYGIALCGLLLLVPTAWVHHYVWVLPALALGCGGLISSVAGTRAYSRADVYLAGTLLLAAVMLEWSLPHAWDTQPQPAISTFAGLPLRPLLLEARAVGTLMVVVALGVLIPRLLRVREAREEKI
jgi:alpha-1,2-mannosyltransferase